MRKLLVALLLLWTPGVAAAQPPSMLQRMGAWGQQVGAAQQPVTDAYRACTPVLQQTQAALQAQSREQMSALLTSGAYRDCVERMRAAAATARDSLARVAPMPADVERLFHIDSRDILRRAVASIDGMVASNVTAAEALDALAAGDLNLMQRKLHETRQLAGSVFDGQVVLMEALRAGMPMQFHKSIMDIRLALSRGMRALVTADPDLDTGTASAGLRTEATRLRLAGLALRVNWRRESVPIRAAIARLGDPGQAALLAELDRGIEEISANGIRLGTSLEAFPAGRVDPAASIGAMRQLADSDIQVMTLAQNFAVAASRLS